MKVGTRPGIPVQVQLTEAERSIRDTNQRWYEQSRTARRAVRAVEELVEEHEEREKEPAL